MAKLERTLHGDFDDTLKQIEDVVLNGSLSATLEDSSDFADGTARCSVRIFERYSYTGGNRVSLSVTLFEGTGDRLFLSAVAAGGSQGLMFKFNTFGEEAFLDTLRDALD